MNHAYKNKIADYQQIVDGSLMDRICAAVDKAIKKCDPVIFVPCFGLSNADKSYLMLYGYRFMQSKLTNELTIWITRH